MKRLITLIAFLTLAGVQLGAQTQLSEILGRLDDSRVTIDYSCGIDNAGVRLNVRGKVIAQQNCYYAEGAGMRIYCDGTTRWTVDTEAREVYIETASGVRELIDGRETYLGAISDLTLDSVRYTGLSGDLSPFVFNTRDLDSAWVVTDLR